MTYQELRKTMFQELQELMEYMNDLKDTGFITFEQRIAYINTLISVLHAIGQGSFVWPESPQESETNIFR